MSASAHPLRSQEPVRCLVIQLARLGDTLQSLMALRAAQQLYPQLEIYFLCRERFSSAAVRVSWVKKVITFPTDSMLGPVLAHEKSEVQAIGDIARWIAPLVKDPWDIVVNWSFSEASSYLTALLPARVKLGYTRRRDSSFSGSDGWSHYVQGIVQGNISQNIHLTDILTTQLLTALQIHMGEPMPNGNSPITSKTFFNLSLEKNPLYPALFESKRKQIAIQLGAGQKSKTWNPKSWAKFAYYLFKKNPEYGIVLLGGPEDRARADVFLQDLSNLGVDPSSIISLVGESTFDLWASVIGRSQWLLSGDTAAIHLASVLGTRVLNLSIGPVKFVETGPYGNGHYVITSGMSCRGCNPDSPGGIHTCDNDISPEVAYSVWSYGIQEWTHLRKISLENYSKQLGWLSYFDSVRVYRSRIRTSSNGGGVVYEPLLKRPLSVDDWSGMAIGHVARSWYCGWTPPVGQEIEREMISPDLIQKIRNMQESIEILSKVLTQAGQTALLLRQKSSTLKSEKIMGIQDRDDLQYLGKTLLELDALIERVIKAQPALLAFSQMAKVLVHHLKGSHLTDLGRETADCYRQLNDGVLVFKEWVKFTLELARPVAIQPQPVRKDLYP